MGFWKDDCLLPQVKSFIHPIIPLIQGQHIRRIPEAWPITGTSQSKLTFKAAQLKFCLNEDIQNILTAPEVNVGSMRPPPTDSVHFYCASKTVSEESGGLEKFKILAAF